MDSRYVADFLLRCTIIGFAFLFLWFFMILAAGDFAYSIHRKLFDVTRHDFDILNYYGMAFLKISIFVLFLIPHVAIRLTDSSLR